jgi:hypothetical protein
MVILLLLFTFGPNPNPQPTLSKTQSGINEEISQLLLEGEYKSVIFFFAAQANSSTVHWYITDPESVPSFNSLVLTTEPENRVSEILNLARSYDAAIFATSEMPGLQAQPPIIFPIHALQDDFLAELESIWGTKLSIKMPEYTILVNPKFD